MINKIYVYGLQDLQNRELYTVAVAGDSSVFCFIQPDSPFSSIQFGNIVFNGDVCGHNGRNIIGQ